MGLLDDHFMNPRRMLLQALPTRLPQVTLWMGTVGQFVGRIYRASAEMHCDQASCLFTYCLC